MSSPSSGLTCDTWRDWKGERWVTFGSWDRLRCSLKPRNYCISVMLGAASQEVPPAAQCSAGMESVSSRDPGKNTVSQGQGWLLACPVDDFSIIGQTSTDGFRSCSWPRARCYHTSPFHLPLFLLSPVPCSAFLWQALGKGVGLISAQLFLLKWKQCQGKRVLVYMCVCVPIRDRKNSRFFFCECRIECCLFFLILGDFFLSLPEAMHERNGWK